ncbi:hypothetical protein NUACC26_095690 [Scytonema sp. NUACC26]
MVYTSPKLLTFEQFIIEYRDNPRYELIDGELRDMEPTGSHEEVAGNIAGRIYAEILRTNFNWLIPKTCLIKPPAAEATALRPDVIVLDKAQLSQEPLWQKELINVKFKIHCVLTGSLKSKYYQIYLQKEKIFM